MGTARASEGLLKPGGREPQSVLRTCQKQPRAALSRPALREEVPEEPEEKPLPLTDSGPGCDSLALLDLCSVAPKVAVNLYFESGSLSQGGPAYFP